VTPESITAAPPHQVPRPVMRMSWRDLTFLHWPYEPATIRPLVPAGLQLDLHDGIAWVGLVPFLMTDVSVPRGPAVPWISEFPETNVRTYVFNSRGERGVWFFSLDAARLLAVIGGRTLFSLPYFWATMSIDRRPASVRYTSRRRGPSGLDIQVRIGEAIASPTSLEHFLTARWRLFAERRGRILQSKVHHQTWPLFTAEAITVEQDLFAASGLPAPRGEPLAHFSPNVDVMAGSLE
jgi:uncharacterized protein YqjF (DUF2071 family)